MKLRLLSLGAGVQSTALALMACRGELTDLDGAIFADTGAEPQRVYRHLEMLEVEFQRAGIPLHRVSNGHLIKDTLDENSRFVSIPYFTLAPEGTTVTEYITEPCPAGCAWIDYDKGADPFGLSEPPMCPVCFQAGEIITGQHERLATRKEREGIGRRQCTHEYKLKPINRAVRMLLGARAPEYRTVPRGHIAEQWIGFSVDEIHRVNDRQENRYTTKRYPLIEMGWSRKDCQRWLRSIGWDSVEKSACIECPYHGNAYWRDLRDNHPDEFQQAVDFDAAIRKGGVRAGRPALKGQAFLHRSCLPLSIAPIDKLSRAERRGDQLEIYDEFADQGDPDGCSPYGCRSGQPVDSLSVTPDVTRDSRSMFTKGIQN